MNLLTSKVSKIRELTICLLLIVTLLVYRHTFKSSVLSLDKHSKITSKVNGIHLKVKMMVVPIKILNDVSNSGKMMVRLRPFNGTCHISTSKCLSHGTTIETLMKRSTLTIQTINLKMRKEWEQEKKMIYYPHLK